MGAAAACFTPAISALLATLFPRRMALKSFWHYAAKVRPNIICSALAKNAKYWPMRG